MFKVIIFVIGLISGISIHYIIAPSADSQQIDETEFTSDNNQKKVTKNETQLLREIASLKGACPVKECPVLFEKGESYDSNPNAASWEEENDNETIEPEFMEDQFEPGEDLDY